MSIHSKKPVFDGVSGSMPIPLKIAGSEMRTIEELIVPIRTPRVVLESAIHL